MPDLLYIQDQYVHIEAFIIFRPYDYIAFTKVTMFSYIYSSNLIKWWLKDHPHIKRSSTH